MRFLFKFFFSLTLLLLVTLSLLLLEERKTFDIRTLVQVDPIPHTEKLIHEKKYVEAQEYLSYFIAFDYVKENPKSDQLLKEIKEKREDYTYRAEKFLEGITKGGSDEDIGKASAIASDFLVIGDIRDLSIESAHYINDEKVDKTMVALSSLGLIATASTVYTMGATAPVKTSISVLKYAKRVNKLPPWLSKQLIEQAKIAKETKSLDKIQTLFDPIYKLHNRVGPNQTLSLLKNTKNLQELNSAVKFTSRFGKKSPTLLKLTNNSATKYAKELPTVQPKTFMYASTYGEEGLKGLKRMGGNKFMKRVGLTANLSKTTYKGNLNSFFNYLLKNIPNSLLYAISFLGLFYFLQKFYTVSKRVFSFRFLHK